MEQSYFDRLGEPKVRAIIDAFVDRMFDDFMIGFFFRYASKTRIKKFEFQHAAVFLGAPLAYEGKPLDAAHKPHGIAGGHFERRKKLLADVLNEFDVPDDVREAWLEHTESQRALITGDPGSQCHS